MRIVLFDLLLAVAAERARQKVSAHDLNHGYEALQALSLGLGGQRGGVRGGQVPQAGEHLVHRVGGAGGIRKGLHRVLTSLGKELAGRSVRQKVLFSLFEFSSSC
jgi:hypothetical protein